MFAVTVLWILEAGDVYIRTWAWVMGVAYTRCVTCLFCAMASADALDEEWWLPPEERERERALAKRKGSNDTDVTKKKKRKTISRELSTKKVCLSV